MLQNLLFRSERLQSRVLVCIAFISDASIDCITFLADMAPPKTANAKRGTMYGSVSQLIKFAIRASPLPKALSEFLQDNLATLKRMGAVQSTSDRSTRSDMDGLEEDEEFDVQGEIIRKPSVKPDEFWKALEGECKAVGGEWTNVANRIWAFGPQRAGGCVLIDSRADSATNS